MSRNDIDFVCSFPELMTINSAGINYICSLVT